MKRYVPGSAARIGGWPTNVAECWPDEVERTAEELLAQHLDAWKDFGTVSQFLQDHVPGYQAVRDCRTRVNVGRANGRARVVLEGCGIVPYCLACTDALDMRRAGRVVQRLRACAPEGNVQMRTWVFKARLSEDLDTWGMSARERIRDFKGTVKDALRDIHGEGYGASLCYHDVGERRFAKPDPHIDVIVNGWKLGSKGQPRKIGYVDLANGGKQEVGRKWMRHIKQAFPLAEEDVWSIHMSTVPEPARDVWTIAKYHAREVLNFRHLDYDREASTIMFTTERDEIGDSTMPVADFTRELRNYVRRSGGWKSQALRSFVGHMADGVIKNTSTRFGNDYEEHGEDCPCPKCVVRDWREGADVRLPDEEQEAFGGR